jgi:hypothetical protein
MCMYNAPVQLPQPLRALRRSGAGVLPQAPAGWRHRTSVHALAAAAAAACCGAAGVRDGRPQVAVA